MCRYRGNTSAGNFVKKSGSRTFRRESGAFLRQFPHDAPDRQLILFSGAILTYRIRGLDAPGAMTPTSVPSTSGRFLSSSPSPVILFRQRCHEANSHNDKHIIANGASSLDNRRALRRCPGTLHWPGSKARFLPPPRASFYHPFEFSEEQYYRASLQVIQSQDQMLAGFLLFQRECEGFIEEPDRGLVVAVGGDSFQAIVLLLQGRQEARPLTLDLLWQVLQRGRDVSKRDWSVLRVAIVGLSDTAYLGRIFFGNKDTGEVAWDVDCRPSDATWLAIKCKAPMFIHRDVWATTAAPLDELQDRAHGQMGRVQRELAVHRKPDVLVDAGNKIRNTIDVPTLLTTLRRQDPEPLKRLKMELKVALHEEDYQAAIRIRDHPFIRLYLCAVSAEREGDMEAAAMYEEKLRNEIARYENDGGLTDEGGSGTEVS